MDRGAIISVKTNKTKCVSCMQRMNEMVAWMQQCQAESIHERECRGGNNWMDYYTHQIHQEKAIINQFKMCIEINRSIKFKWMQSKKWINRCVPGVIFWLGDQTASDWMLSN